MVGDFNTPLISVGGSSRQKIKEKVALNEALDMMDITDTYRISKEQNS